MRRVKPKQSQARTIKPPTDLFRTFSTQPEQGSCLTCPCQKPKQQRKSSYAAPIFGFRSEQFVQTALCQASAQCCVQPVMAGDEHIDIVHRSRPIQRRYTTAKDRQRGIRIGYVHVPDMFYIRLMHKPVKASVMRRHLASTRPMSDAWRQILYPRQQTLRFSGSYVFAPHGA